MAVKSKTGVDWSFRFRLFVSLGDNERGEHNSKRCQELMETASNNTKNRYARAASTKARDGAELLAAVAFSAGVSVAYLELGLAYPASISAARSFDTFHVLARLMPRVGPKVSGDACPRPLNCSAAYLATFITARDSINSPHGHEPIHSRAENISSRTSVHTSTQHNRPRLADFSPSLCAATRQREQKSLANTFSRKYLARISRSIDSTGTTRLVAASIAPQQKRQQRNPRRMWQSIKVLRMND